MAESGRRPGPTATPSPQRLPASLPLPSAPQDSVQEKASACPQSQELNLLREEGSFLQTHAQSSHAHEASVEHLQVVARIRLCLDRAAGFLSEFQEDKGEAPAAPGWRARPSQAARGLFWLLWPLRASPTSPSHCPCSHGRGTAELPPGRAALLCPLAE